MSRMNGHSVDPSMRVPIYPDWLPLTFKSGCIAIGDLLRPDPNWDDWEQFLISATEIAQVADMVETRDHGAADGDVTNIVATVYVLRALDRLPVRRMFWNVTAEARILCYVGQLGVYL